MNYNRPLGPKDERSLPDYDTAFTGLNERLSPMQLQPGEIWRGSNLRMRDGKASTRLGVQICPWMRGDGRTPWNEVYGGLVFSDTNSSGSVEWFLIAADGGVWRTRPGQVATAVPMPGGVTLTADSFTMFVQCFGVIILLRGPNFAPLVCTNLDLGFGPIVQSDQDILDGLKPIPNASYGLSLLNRLLLIEGKDLLAVSDELDYTSYLAPTNTFRITEGNTDTLVSVFPFGPQQLLCLKDQSVIGLANMTGDLSAVQQEEITRQYGCGAAQSVVTSGNNVYWVSTEGRVRSLTLTQLNQTQDTDQALSDPLIDVTQSRINGNYISGMVSAIWDSKLYLGAPLDDAVVFGTDLVIAGSVYDPDLGTCVVNGFIVGQTYYYQPGANEGQFDGGTVTLQDEGAFVAMATSATLDGVAGQPVTGTLKRYYPGVNNAVLVYDFLNQSWCGADESEQPIFGVKQFLKATYQGRKRLFFLTVDGMLRLYEEGYEDEVFAPVAQPYVDILLNARPAGGNTIRVNGQTLVTADAAAAANSGDSWGCNTLDNARENLFLGYNTGGWTGEGTNEPCTVTQIDWGIRFSGGLVFNNPVMPSVVITGDWAYVDAHSGLEITSVPIVTKFTGRGMMTRSYVFQNVDKKRFLAFGPLMATWAPKYSVGTLVNGLFSDENYRKDITRDNTVYDIQGEANWDPSNVNDDHATAKRLDYSVVLPDLGFSLGVNGVSFDLLQVSTERVPINEFGHYVQLDIANTEGRMEIWMAGMEAQEGEKLSAEVI